MYRLKILTTTKPGIDVKEKIPSEYKNIQDKSDAIKLCEQYIKTYNLKSEDWVGGYLYKDGEQVDYITYNCFIYHVGHVYYKQEVIDPYKMEIAIFKINFGHFPTKVQDNFIVDYSEVPTSEQITQDLVNITKKAIQDASNVFGVEIDIHNFDNKINTIGLNYAGILEEEYRSIYFRKLLHTYYHAIQYV